MFRHARDETEAAENRIMAEKLEAKDTEYTEGDKIEIGVCVKWNVCECNFLFLLPIQSDILPTYSNYSVRS